MGAERQNRSGARLACSYVLIGLILCCTSCDLLVKKKSADPDQDAMSLMMPCRIEIAEPFTRVRDFDGNGTLDGIELLMQAVNAVDNPGVQIVGSVRVELYEFVEASAHPKGTRVDRWDVDVSSTELQQKHWNQLTQMYEFRLAVDPAVLPRKRKFVLAVTYNTLQGAHLMDECVLEYDGRSFAGS